MKKFLTIMLVLQFVAHTLSSQTWTGGTSTAWNNSGNWNPATVPTAASNVTIPASVASSRWPVLSSDITVNTLNTNPGCQLNVNGFKINIVTTNTYNYMIGGTINNTNAATDIEINWNNGGGGYVAYVRSMIFNDNVVFNLTGSNQFYESDDGTGNIFNGNATFNISNGLPVYISQNGLTQFKGNLSVVRIVAGSTRLFATGGSVAGNFSFLNNTAGDLGIGITTYKTAIGGKVDITANYTTPNNFQLYRLINQTAGGVIAVQNSKAMDVQSDTLKLVSCSITGYTGSAYAYLINNSITANVTIADDLSYQGGYVSYLRGNIITGTCTITNKGTNQLFDADQPNSGNTYNGNAFFNAQGSGPIYLSHGAVSLHNGNLTINRTADGPTQAFAAGGNVKGNLSYTNLVNGSSIFGNGTTPSIVTGTLNIAVKNTSPAGFTMYRLTNKTNGGSLSLEGTRAFDFRNDTLLLAGFSCLKYTGSAYAYLFSNSITAAINVADDASYSGGYNFDLRSNVFTGNASFTHNGTNNIYETNSAGTANIFNGNTSFNMKGSGTLFLSNDDASQFKGNLSVFRTSDGSIQAFNSGGTITGNFTYSFLASGNSSLGNLSSRTLINGTVNINVKQPAPGAFVMYRLINKTTGGVIALDSTRAFDFRNDTLLLTSLSCLRYYGSAYAYLLNNNITAALTTADDVAYSGGYDLKINNNRITGNASFTHKGTNNINEADAQANIFNGNTSFIMQGSGALYVSHGAASQFNGNLSIIRNTNGGHIQAFNGGGNVTGNFSYTNLVNGNTYFGNTGYQTLIHGTITVNVKNKTPGDFVMNRLINQTNGGSLNLDSTKAFTFQNDTLLLSSFTCQRYYGSAYAYLLHNHITGVVSIADDGSYSGGYNLQINDNRITGNASFTHKGTNNIYEAGNAGENNIFTGNTSFLMQGSGALYVSQAATSQFIGDLSITRNTSAGHTQVFNAGGMVTGNFTFNNNIGGNCYLGRDIVATNITGQVNFNVQHISTGDMQVFNLKNQTTGGVISILDTRGFNFRNDTLTANTISVTGYRGNAYAYLLNNQLTADVTIADDASYSGGYATFFRDNVIVGNSSITNKGSNIIYESDAGGLGNYYNGNVTFSKAGSGAINIGQALITEVSQNFTIAGTSGINITNLRFKGSTTSIIAKTGTIPIVVKNLFLNKTGAGNVTLNDSVQVSQSAVFTSGIVVSAANKELIFLNAASHAGVSDDSHVSGPVSKIGNQAFSFPIGNGQAMQKAAISAPVNNTDRFRAQYFASSPHPTYDTSNHAATLKNVSGAQYWIIERLSGSSNVTVALDYGKPRGILITGTQADYRVARWTGATWQNLGNGGTTGTITEGSVITAAPVTAFSPFTIAATSGINPMSNTAPPLQSPACANTTLVIPFQTSGVFNSGNIFTAQLSNAAGSFANPVNIGTLNLAPNGLNVANNISAFLPSSAIVTGTGYRVRITSSNPVNNGSANASNITINSLYVGADTTVLLNCSGNSANLTLLFNTTGLSPVWNTGNPSAAGAGFYRLSVQNGIGCRDTAFATVIFEVATWTGIISSDWHTAGNWNINKVPVSRTHVIIPTGAANPCIISTSNATAASVQVRNGAVFNATNGKVLVITGTCTVLPQ